MLLRAVRREGDGLGRAAGVIINIASGAALRGSPRSVHYVASKGGILSLTRAMALELAPLSHQGQCDRAGAHGYSPAALR